MRRHTAITLTSAALSMAVAASALAQAPSTTAHPQILAELAHGGLVIVMRHARSPQAPPAPDVANPDNLDMERQLDREGRDTAAAMGEALRALRVPIGQILSSPTYRARETLRAAGLAPFETVDALGDGGQSMHGVTEAQAAWLRTTAAQRPASGNTLVVTHQPNLARAFPDWGATVADGESVILRPDGRGGIDVVARIPIAEWARLRGPRP